MALTYPRRSLLAVAAALPAAFAVEAIPSRLLAAPPSAFLVEAVTLRDGVEVAHSVVVGEGRSCTFKDVTARPYLAGSDYSERSVDDGVVLTLSPAAFGVGQATVRYEVSSSMVSFDRFGWLDLPNGSVAFDSGDLVLAVGQWIDFPSARVPQPGRHVRVRVTPQGV